MVLSAVNAIPVGGLEAFLFVAVTQWGGGGYLRRQCCRYSGEMVDAYQSVLLLLVGHPYTV